jgi:DUF971 family protein
MPGPRSNTPWPTEITVHQKSLLVQISFSNGKTFQLPFEFLRVYSPSAEVRGHGAGQEVLQVGKRGVAVTEVHPVGTYAVRFTFSDEHDTGIYSWDYLYSIGTNHEELWQRYLKRLEEAGASRDPQPGAFSTRPRGK